MHWLSPQRRAPSRVVSLVAGHSVKSGGQAQLNAYVRLQASPHCEEGYYERTGAGQ